MIWQIGFLSSSKLIYLVSLLKRKLSFWPIKLFYFLNKQGLIEHCHCFSFNWVNLYLSVSNIRMLILSLFSELKISLVCGLIRVKLWFFWVDISRFCNFFIFRPWPIFHVFFSRFVTLLIGDILHYWFWK